MLITPSFKLMASSGHVSQSPNASTVGTKVGSGEGAGVVGSTVGLCDDGDEVRGQTKGWLLCCVEVVVVATRSHITHLGRVWGPDRQHEPRV